MSVLKRTYPLGMQSFRIIREDGAVYVDKTELIYQMIQAGRYNFLSRPRRFGKSLLVSTLMELFSGNKALFEGLWIYDHWDWNTRYPVIRLSFNDVSYEELGLKEALSQALAKKAKSLDIELSFTSLKDRFAELIEVAAKKYGQQVVILIDEYDKPITDYITKPEIMDQNRSVMKEFYSVLKGDSADDIRFLFITGITQYAKVSIFSDLNNLDNISLSNQFSAIAGITQQELESYFATEIAEMMQDTPDILDQIKTWYNGYTWDMQTWVYNPFSLLHFMAKREFKDYWYQSGTPSFLVALLKKNTFREVEHLEAGERALMNFEVDPGNLAPILFQSGYLTIKHITEGGVYELGYPNREVKGNMLEAILSIYRGVNPTQSIPLYANIAGTLRIRDINAFIAAINALFAGITYEAWNADQEAIFNGILQTTFTLVGLDVKAEVHSAKGRCDLLVETAEYIYVMELKLDGNAQDALNQIKAKGYMEPYLESAEQLPNYM
ncbi:PD-(D/E)XK nuclease superfamily protein [Arachidicoccus rhizosphaerae]|uniref:PD-(D/E)XK nuclease superfamily protein n=2 Tax=Arachidicoccus rhizosphaerae TaxID=551991 RepID=A0A1H4CXJ4_9BACT|nr:PD-(D/E)XK nuclease superfamily protein [Arachidicoccus rhizosphaerae]